jgi:methyl-accepting chemotaxis protein
MSQRIPSLRTPGIDHKKIILEDTAARQSEIQRFNKRLCIGLILTVIASFIALTLYFSNIWNRENTALESRLETYTELRDGTLQRFLTSLDNEVRLWSAHPDIVKDAKLFSRDWATFSAEDIASIRAQYINKIPPQTLSNAHQDYNALHDEVHPTLERFNRHHGYYDVFIFDLKGNLVYTVEKEDDFGYNFLSDGSIYADSGLGRAYRAALAETDPDAVVFDDFAGYAPSAGDPAAFLASQVIDESKKVIGIYAVQIPLDKFNEVLSHSQGLGETGQSYLIGEDMLMRNQARLSEANTMLTTKVENAAVKEALAGRKSLQKVKLISGEAGLAAARPLTFKGINYAVATEMSIEEKRAPMRPYILFYMAAIFFLLVFGVLAYAILRARSGRALAELTDVTL